MTNNETSHLAGDRVREHTPAVVNARIDRLTRSSADATAERGRDAVLKRLAELDREWDIDRALMVNFAVVGGAAFALGLLRSRRSAAFGSRRNGLLYLLGAQLGFLFWHGTVGWCPPVSLFRRLGLRTQREIEAERALLSASLAQPATP
jgi:hypothetical protein